MIRKVRFNEIYKGNIWELLGGLFLFWLLFNNYFRNAFSIVPQKWFSEWQMDSEKLIISSINYARSNGVWCDYGLIHGYSQQIGLQGLVFKVLNHMIQRPWIPLNFLHGFVVVCFCILIYIFLSWVKREFNSQAALFAYLSFFFSRWMVVSARNLYWVVGTLILPFVSMLLLAEWDKKRQTRLKLWPFAFVTFITCFLRIACGFEMVSCVMVSATCPLFYYACKDKWGWKFFLRRFAASTFGALSSFGVAMVINGLQQVFYYGSLQQAVNNILYTVSKRTGLFNIEVAPILTGSLEAGKWSVLKSYLLEGSPVIGGGTYDYPDLDIWRIISGQFD